jgi:catechol 2,3-dioxygenase-like lactoylglutathione lyase family enzyme
MQGTAMVVPTLPVGDLDVSIPWFRDTLGLALLDQNPFSARFDGGGGTQLSLFKRGPVQREHTMCHFEVQDIAETVRDLKSRGVVFEEYTEGPLVTTDSIAQLGPAKGAWFKDPDGNVIGLRQGQIPGHGQ